MLRTHTLLVGCGVQQYAPHMLHPTAPPIQTTLSHPSTGPHLPSTPHLPSPPHLEYRGVQPQLQLRDRLYGLVHGAAGDEAVHGDGARLPQVIVVTVVTAVGKALVVTAVVTTVVVAVAVTTVVVAVVVAVVVTAVG